MNTIKNSRLLNMASFVIDEGDVPRDIKYDLNQDQREIYLFAAMTVVASNFGINGWTYDCHDKGPVTLKSNLRNLIYHYVDSFDDADRRKIYYIVCFSMNLPYHNYEEPDVTNITRELLTAKCNLGEKDLDFLEYLRQFFREGGDFESSRLKINVLIDNTEIIGVIGALQHMNLLACLAIIATYKCSSSGGRSLGLHELIIPNYTPDMCILKYNMPRGMEIFKKYKEVADDYTISWKKTVAQILDCLKLKGAVCKDGTTESSTKGGNAKIPALPTSSNNKTKLSDTNASNTSSTTSTTTTSTTSTTAESSTKGENAKASALPAPTSSKTNLLSGTSGQGPKNNSIKRKHIDTDVSSTTSTTSTSTTSTGASADSKKKRRITPTYGGSIPYDRSEATNASSVAAEKQSTINKISNSSMGSNTVPPVPKSTIKSGETARNDLEKKLPKEAAKSQPVVGTRPESPTCETIEPVWVNKPLDENKPLPFNKPARVLAGDLVLGVAVSEYQQISVLCAPHKDKGGVFVRRYNRNQGFNNEIDSIVVYPVDRWYQLRSIEAWDNFYRIEMEEI